MKNLNISRVIFVAILGLGSMAVPGKADHETIGEISKADDSNGAVELKHPIELGAKCKAKFEYSLSSIRWKDQYYKAFAYAYDSKGRYTCALSRSEGRAIESFNDTRGSYSRVKRTPRADYASGCDPEPDWAPRSLGRLAFP